GPFETGGFGMLFGPMLWSRIKHSRLSIAQQHFHRFCLKLAKIVTGVCGLIPPSSELSTSKARAQDSSSKKEQTGRMKVKVMECRPCIWSDLFICNELR